MSSKIVAAVPRSLLTQKSRSGSRSKSAKQQGISEHMSHSKSLAANHAIVTAVNGMRGQPGGVTDMNDHGNEHRQPLLMKNQLSTSGVGRIGGLAMASISSYNIANINRQNDLNRHISTSPYSIQSRLASQNNQRQFNIGDQGNKAQTAIHAISATKCLEDAERRYQELFEAEKKRLHKKGQADKELNQKLQKKLKVMEKKAKDESRVAMELRKHYEQMKGKLDKQTKEQTQQQVQMKKLLSQFLVQRKALELSIQKNKKWQEELSQVRAKQIEHDESKKMHTRQVENFEDEIASLKSRFRKDKEALETELQEKRHQVQRQSAEIKDFNSKISNFRQREEEFEAKIKGLWADQEKKSKMYQKDIQGIHENYRNVTSTAAEAEARLNMYKQDWEKATQAERTARQEVLKLTFQYDEVIERHKYMERKYLQLVQRVGASAEDLEAVEMIMANANHQSPITNDKGLNKDRMQSRHGNGAAADQAQYYLFGDKNRDQQAQKKDTRHSRGQSDRQKTNIVEVLDFDQEEQAPAGNMFYSRGNNDEGSDNMAIHQQPGGGRGMRDSHQQVASINSNQQNAALLQVNDSGDLLKKLIDNIQNNHSLQNESVRARFKLQLIEKEEDLHRYKNLLNAMAALFYTNHRMKDVTSFFGSWRQLANEVQQRDEAKARKQVAAHSIESPRGQDDNFVAENILKNPEARFSIDPDDKVMAWEDQNQDSQGREHIDLSSQGDDDSSVKRKKNPELDDTDTKVDRAAKRFIEGLRKVGPHSKHILNYSYPPLLYQRGDDEEEEDEESQDQGECDEDEDDSMPGSQDIDGDGMGQLPEFHDSDDDELIALGGALEHPNTQDDGPDDSVKFQHDEEFLQQLKAVELDNDLKHSGNNGFYRHQELDGQEPFDEGDADSYQGGSGNNISGLEDLEGLDGVVGDEEFSDDEMGIVGGHATNLDGLDKDQIMKMIDQEVDGFDDYDDEDQQMVGIDGVELELDDQIDDDLDDDDDELGDQEMFNQHLLAHQNRGNSNGDQHDSTIINSSQNTSLEQNFLNEQH